MRNFYRPSLFDPTSRISKTSLQEEDPCPFPALPPRSPESDRRIVCQACLPRFSLPKPFLPNVPLWSAGGAAGRCRQRPNSSTSIPTWSTRLSIPATTSTNTPATNGSPPIPFRRPGLLEHRQRPAVVERKPAARNAGSRQRQRSQPQLRPPEDRRLLGRLHGRKRHRSRRPEAAAARTRSHRRTEVQERHHARDRPPASSVSRRVAGRRQPDQRRHSSASPDSRITTMRRKSWRRSTRAA